MRKYVLKSGDGYLGNYFYNKNFYYAKKFNYLSAKWKALLNNLEIKDAQKEEEYFCKFHTQLPSNECYKIDKTYYTKEQFEQYLKQMNYGCVGYEVKVKGLFHNQIEKLTSDSIVYPVAELSKISTYYLYSKKEIKEKCEKYDTKYDFLYPKKFKKFTIEGITYVLKEEWELFWKELNADHPVYKLKGIEPSPNFFKFFDTNIKTSFRNWPEYLYSHDILIDSILEERDKRI